MFEHSFEKEIASLIINNYHQKSLACNRDNKFYHSIGMLFPKLLKGLEIEIDIRVKEGKVELITKSSLIDCPVPDGGVDVSPIISEDMNKHELRVIKFIQTISFLKLLEEHNYIIIFESIKIKERSTPEIYDIYEIRDPNLIHFINRLRGARIIPTTALIEIASHDYETVDKRRYDRQVKLSEEAINEARKANKIATKSNKLAKRSNCTAISIAILTFILSIGIAIAIPSSLTKTTIHEIGREIRLNTNKESAPKITINNNRERIDSTKYEKIQNK